MNTETKGWQQLISGYPWFKGEGRFQLPAYSEFMPAPWLGLSPCGSYDKLQFPENDPYGWNITEIEEAFELKPGIEHIGHQIMNELMKLGKGITEYHISGHHKQNLINNPYWPEELASHAGQLTHERFVVFLPLMLSRTQDDKGRVTWTLFGGSEDNPEKAFWKSFYTSPENELPENDFINFINGILNDAYNLDINNSGSLYNGGFRILPSDNESSLPSWASRYIIAEISSFETVKFLLTFRPFADLPDEAKKLYLNGRLNLLPFPGSLVFWGMPTYLKLKQFLPFAMQIPVLKLVSRNTGREGLRVPQAGWLYEPHPDIKETDFHHELIKGTYHRTHRWQRINRHEDELLMQPRVAQVAKVLFSTNPDIMGLYDKPMVRNCQIWTRDFELLIDGPKAKIKDIKKAETAILSGGLFGYRFLYPAMRVGMYEVYWKRPLVAYLSQKSGEVKILPDVLNGYITAYPLQPNSPIVELWPRILQRPIQTMAIQHFNNIHDHNAHQTSKNIINLLEHSNIFEGKPLPVNFARHMVRLKKHETLEQWFEELPGRCNNPEIGQKVVSELIKIVEPDDKAAPLPAAITYQFTANRAFEEAWWNDIYFLAHGQFKNKDNADCVQDEITLKEVSHCQRDLEQLGDYLIKRHNEAIGKAGMEGKAICAELPFEWRTDFDFSIFGGWKQNKEGHTYERDIVVIIPGKNRTCAVALADHYDTAYMEDIYEKEKGGTGARLSAAGADDNYSATATLLQAAPIFLQLSKEGKLECDVWLLHLTGEEFPSDCMGARHFCQSLVEKNLKARFDKDKWLDLSNVTIKGVFVMDMIGHNKYSDQDIFQISPGKSMESVKIAYQALLANLIWNAGTHTWNSSEEKKNCGRGKRTSDEKQIPDMAKHLSLYGEIRTHFDPYSSIYNTDGQIFSDVGVPVVLFMENYDLHRTGYHDTKDTMENIDLDYGAALAAICIETAARVAGNE